jgi:hypothetical protein
VVLLQHIVVCSAPAAAAAPAAATAAATAAAAAAAAAAAVAATVASAAATTLQGSSMASPYGVVAHVLVAGLQVLCVLLHALLLQLHLVARCGG